MRSKTDMHMLLWLLDRAIDIQEFSSENRMSFEALSVVLAPNLWSDITFAASHGNKWFALLLAFFLHLPYVDDLSIAGLSRRYVSDASTIRHNNLGIACLYQKSTILVRNLHQHQPLKTVEL